MSEHEETRSADLDVWMAGVVEESVVDGPGVRLALFMQGCLGKGPDGEHCPGCHNPGTWAVDAGERRTVGELAALMANPLLDGVTLTGVQPPVGQSTQHVSSYIPFE